MVRVKIFPEVNDEVIEQIEIEFNDIRKKIGEKAAKALTEMSRIYQDS